jgi:hypothetical protein
LENDLMSQLEEEDLDRVEEAHYEVHQILGHRIIIDGDGEPREEYLVQYKATWEPAASLTQAPQLVQEFERQHGLASVRRW